jgi:DNA repair protein RecN (Recombination protein N)
MLSSIKVRNLAIVEKAAVEFGSGLNVITGETGAGKSIIMGALSLVLGDRADKSLLRTGETQCVVEAEFQLPDSSSVDAILEELAMDPCEDGCLTIRRTVTATGSGKNIINDCSATVQTLKKIGDLLVDMHGPHDHQSLLSNDFQTDILDSHGNLWKQRAKYDEKYREWLEIELHRSGLEGDDDTVEQQIDLLQYQIKEIEDAALKEGEDTLVEGELTTVSNASRITELGNGIQAALSDADESAFNAVATSLQYLQELEGIFPEAEEWRKEANSASIQIQELASAISARICDIETEPERLQWLDDRLALISKMKRKYGGSIEQVHEHHIVAKQKLDDLESRGERIAALDKMLVDTEKEMLTEAKELTSQRKQSSAKLSKTITGELQGLGFEHGAFEVSISESSPGPSGCDLVDFGFAPNAGEEMRPLKAIASSGEISRVMLAVKAVLAKHDKIPVLVFDEIDANVGGEMGNAIGKRLSAISASHQVICITHLPQVAVFGAHHYMVAKGVEDGRTRTQITAVLEEARTEEVARMLGGKDITSVVVDHAKELLSAAK